MRWVYGLIGVIGAVLSLGGAYLVLLAAMLGDAGRGGLAIVSAVVVAGLLNLVAAFLDPRTPAPRWMLLVSAAVWPLLGIAFFFVGYFNAPDFTLGHGLAFAATVAAPALLPLAAWAFARWQFGPA